MILYHEIISKNRENKVFLYSILPLPKDVQNKVQVVYAFFRTALEFGEQDPPDMIGFDKYAQQYRDELGGEKFHNPFSEPFVEMIKNGDLHEQWVEDFFRVVRTDMQKATYQDQSELEHYIYAAGDIVGKIAHKLLSLPNDKLAASQALGKLTLHISILTNIATAHKNGKVYIPQDEMKKAGLSQLSEKSARSNRKQFNELILLQTSHIHPWRKEAYDALSDLSRDMRRPMQTFLDCESTILDAIEDDPYALFSKKPIMSTPRIFSKMYKNFLIRS